MSEFARDLGLDASSGFAGVARRRAVRKLPNWVRLLVVLSVASGLWAAIIFGLHALFAG